MPETKYSFNKVDRGWEEPGPFIRGFFSPYSVPTKAIPRTFLIC